jgi:hypothetical protein
VKEKIMRVKGASPLAGFGAEPQGFVCGFGFLPKNMPPLSGGLRVIIMVFDEQTA